VEEDSDDDDEDEEDENTDESEGEGGFGSFKQLSKEEGAEKWNRLHAQNRAKVLKAGAKNLTPAELAAGLGKRGSNARLTAGQHQILMSAQNAFRRTSNSHATATEGKKGPGFGAGVSAGVSMGATVTDTGGANGSILSMAVAVVKSSTKRVELPPPHPAFRLWMGMRLRTVDTNPALGTASIAGQKVMGTPPGVQESPNLLASCTKVWVQQPDCFRAALVHSLKQLQLHQLGSRSTVLLASSTRPRIVGPADQVSFSASASPGEVVEQQGGADEGAKSEMDKLDNRLWMALLHIRLGVAIFHARASSMPSSQSSSVSQWQSASFSLGDAALADDFVLSMAIGALRLAGLTSLHGSYAYAAANLAAAADASANAKGRWQRAVAVTKVAALLGNAPKVTRTDVGGTPNVGGSSGPTRRLKRAHTFVANTSTATGTLFGGDASSSSGEVAPATSANEAGVTREEWLETTLSARVNIVTKQTVRALCETVYSFPAIASGAAGAGISADLQECIQKFAPELVRMIGQHSGGNITAMGDDAGYDGAGGGLRAPAMQQQLIQIVEAQDFDWHICLGQHRQHRQQREANRNTNGTRSYAGSDGNRTGASQVVQAQAPVLLGGLVSFAEGDEEEEEGSEEEEEEGSEEEKKQNEISSCAAEKEKKQSETLGTGERRHLVAGTGNAAARGAVKDETSAKAGAQTAGIDAHVAHELDESLQVLRADHWKHSSEQLERSLLRFSFAVGAGPKG
jgi:hypothetical protein